MAKLLDLSIAAKLPLGIGLLLVAILGGTTWAAYDEVRRTNRGVATERLETLTDLFAKLLASGMEQRATAMQTLASDASITACLAAPDSEQCEIARAHLEKHGKEGPGSSQVLSIELWDAKAERIVTTGSEIPPSPVESAPSLAASAATLPAAIGPFRLDGERLYYRRIVAVRDQGAIVGYVCEVRRVSNSSQNAQLFPALLGSHAKILLGTRDGLWHDLVQPIASPPTMLADSSEPVEYTRGSEEPLLGLAAGVPGTPWLVATEIPLTPLLANEHRFLRRAAAFSLGMVLVGVAAGWFFSRRVARPLEHVTRGAESLADGRPVPRVPPTRRDELGRLQSSFNSMSLEIEEARERLEGLARHYKLLFDDNPLPMWVSDLETRRFLEVNAAASAHYGYSREEFLERAVEDIEAYPGSGDGRDPFASATVQHRTKDGAVIDVELTQQVLLEGGRRAALTLAHDVTERLAAERAMRESEVALQGLNGALERRIDELGEAQAALRESARAIRDKEALKSAVLEAAIDGIVTMDHRGDVLEFNPAAERIFGLAEADVVGKQLADLLVPPSLRSKHREGLARYLAGGESRLMGRRIEVPALRGNGAEFPAEVSIVRIGHEHPPIFTGFIRDLTERKELEAQLRQSQKMEAAGLLAGGVAHDFNNLLSVIIGYCDLLTSESGSDPRAEIAEIKSAGLRGADLTRQLLAFSRQQVLLPRTMDLNRVLLGMDGLLRRVIGEDIELKLLTRATGMVHADPGQIEQIIMNLVVNARDAMPEGGRLTLETDDVELDSSYAADHAEVAPGPFVMLAVSDTGIGMDEATRRRAFEPFFTTKETGKGTGLGLSTVFGIVKQSGGSIWLYSEPKAGTTLKIFLPRADRPAPGELARPLRTPAEVLGGDETILLVEDDHQLRVLSRKILEQHGYDVLHASSGEEALRISEDHAARIHLLLTDVVMPRMSGRVLADRLRLTRPDMKVLYMSGYTDDAIIRHGVLDRGIAFVQKPLTARMLAKKVREVLETD